ncbi:hypothetical protein U1Q18_017970 [Sarracenia purpurea var. burkii]
MAKVISSNRFSAQLVVPESYVLPPEKCPGFVPPCKAILVADLEGLEPTAAEEFVGSGCVPIGEQRWSDGGAVVTENGGAGLPVLEGQRRGQRQLEIFKKMKGTLRYPSRAL